MKLNEKLVFLRKEQNLSQMQVAEKLGVSRQAISRWEQGIALPSTENLKSLGELYSVPVDVLLNENAELSISKNTTETAAIRKRFSKKTITIIIALLLLAGIVTILCVTLGNKNEDFVPITELENDTTWNSSDADEFILDW